MGVLQVERGNKTSPRHTGTRVTRVRQEPPEKTPMATVLRCSVQQERLPWDRAGQDPVLQWSGKGTD